MTTTFGIIIIDEGRDRGPLQPLHLSLKRIILKDADRN